ncbi:hypothetical protein BH20ACT2_BH20ACT2_23350 [soil metagenome]
MPAGTADRADGGGDRAVPVTGGPRRRRRVVLALAVSLLVLLGLELVVRAVDHRLPPPLVWHTAEAQRKVEQMDALAAAGGADVIFVGSSTVNFAADPAVFTAEAGSATTAYNAALNSGIPRLTATWMLDVVLPRLTPEVVVIGLTSFDLSDLPVDRAAFYDAFLASPAGARATGDDSPLDRADQWLRDRSALWANKASLRDPETVLDLLRGVEVPEDPELAALQPSGRTTYLQDRRFDERPVGVGPNLEGWEVGTRDVAALRRLIGGVRDAGARAVLVRMPITDEYVARHPDGATDYAEYTAATEDIAAEEGAEVVDFDELSDHDLFVDLIHVNRQGSRLFSAELVDKLRAVGALDP